MKNEDPIINFLAQPENLKVALDVSHRLATVRDIFHAAFWPAFFEEMSLRMAQCPYKNNWRISKPEENHLADWVQVHIEPQTNDRHLKFMEICFEQNTSKGGYRLYYGVRWTNRETLGVDTPEYQALKKHLQAIGYNPGDGFWTFTTNTGYVAGGDKFILRMAEDQDAFIKEMAEKPWQLFEETVDLLNGANQLALKD